jgi:hypothetical protein
MEWVTGCLLRYNIILQLHKREVTCAASKQRGEQASPPATGNPPNKLTGERNGQAKIYYEFLRGPPTL